MVITIAAAGMILTSCKGREIPLPVDYTVNGPATVFQTEVADYEVTVPWEQPGTTWSWTVAGATLQNISSDTKIATFSFAAMPANDTAYITIGEKTSDGIKADDKVVKVKVTPFCTFNINNFTGVFDCDEAGYDVYSVNFTKDPVLANTISNDNFWDFAAPGSVVKYTLSGDFEEKVTVPHQTFTFFDATVGWVEGSGTYNGCDNSMTVDYRLFYDDEYNVRHVFSPSKKGTFTVVQKKGPGKMR